MTLSWARRVVPSWDLARSNPRHFATQSGEASAQATVSTATEAARISKAVSEFEAHPTLGLASDVLRFSNMVGVADGRLDSAAAYVLKQTASVPEGLYRTADSVLRKVKGSLPSVEMDFDAGETVALSIRRLRAWLRIYNRDGLAWSDLARSLAANGNNEGARRAITTALFINPNSRLVLRNATRFHLHNKDPERALHLLHHHERTKTDPWLMAGHIAISSIVGKESKLLKRGRHLIEAKRLTAADATELASSIATLELQSGATRVAKKLFNISLVSPNQNTLAQIEWASNQLKLVPDLPVHWLNFPDSAEAGYYRAIFDGDFSTALTRAIGWCQYEPFASRPLIAASFLSSMQGDHHSAVEYAKKGLATEPQDITLLNNLLFAVANDSAAYDLDSLVHQIWSLERKEPDPQTLANFGMLAYLSGELQKGSMLYEAAWTQSRRKNLHEQAANILSFQAHFSDLAGSPDATTIKARAASAVKATALPLSDAVFKHLFLSIAERDVKPASRTKLSAAWNYDAASNTLTFDKRIPIK